MVRCMQACHERYPTFGDRVRKLFGIAAPPIETGCGWEREYL